MGSGITPPFDTFVCAFLGAAIKLIVMFVMRLKSLVGAALVLVFTMAITIGPYVILLSASLCILAMHLFLKVSRRVIQPGISLVLARLYESEHGVLTQVGVVVGGAVKLIEELSKHI